METARDAVSALLRLTSSQGVSKESGKQKRPVQQAKRWHICQNGERAQGKLDDCITCRPDTFCLDAGHVTRENTHPRKRDCRKCNGNKAPRKNLCMHHKPGCTKDACEGCLRRDRCLECNGCNCTENKKLRQKCEKCSGLYCEHGVHKWNRAKAKCACWAQADTLQGNAEEGHPDALKAKTKDKAEPAEEASTGREKAEYHHAQMLGAGQQLTAGVQAGAFSRASLPSGSGGSLTPTKA
jgi:hypothetical protein